MEHLSYVNTFLFPVAVIKRLSERIFPPKENQSDLALNPGVLNNLLRYILTSEALLAANIGLPYGLSVIAVGKK